MKLLSQLLDRLTFVMHLVSGFLLISMMFVTLADVITRAIFSMTGGQLDFTFIGGVELIKYGLLMMVFFALPHSVGRSQVIVDLFTDNFQPRTKALLDGVYMLGYVLLGGAMCYGFYHAVDMSQMSGETTQDLLIPVYYFYGISAFAAAILALSALRISLCNLFAVEGQVSL